MSTATSADEARRAATVAVLPVGSFEQHGAHLPLITDTAVACLIAQRLSDAYGLFLLPPITISCSHEHEGFAGTVSIGAATLIAVIEDIRASLARSGINKLALVNGHGGNYVLSNITLQANTETRSVALFPGREEWNTARERAGMATTAHADMHGGELETSILLYAKPDLVGDHWREADHDADDRPHLLLTGMAAYTASGIIGRPSQATAAKGEAVLESLVETFADHLKILME
ncbi:creatininase family protein [Nocardia panacis]|nr:creatininase family protein [Nocardia panacis]